MRLLWNHKQSNRQLPVYTVYAGEMAVENQGKPRQKSPQTGKGRRDNRAQMSTQKSISASCKENKTRADANFIEF